ncbi:hypothetical protein J7M00_00435 [bacterium]|nr:hypothetical protein [bacterium]
MRLSIIVVIVTYFTVVFAAGGDIFRGERFDESDWSGSRKSTIKAVGLSLLLPGAGEMYLGDRKSSLPFMIADGVIWSLAAGFASYGFWQENQYKSYAQKYGGVVVSGKDDDFFRTIALYDSRDTYNYLALLYERGDAELYPENDEWNWNWRSEEQQLKYYDIWTSSEHSWQRFRICLAAAGINRLVSVINVLRLSRVGVGSPIDVSIATYPDRKNGLGVSISLSQDF